MATDDRVNDHWMIELTRKEAADIIGLLGAQLADRPLIGNQGGACPDIKVTDGRGDITTWMTLVVDSKPRDCTGEIVQGGQTVIVLSRQGASDIIGLIGSLLAGVSLCNYMQLGQCPSFLVQDRGRIMYRLSFSVKGGS